MLNLDALSFTIVGAARASGLSRSRIYELVAKGRLDARKAGRQTLITATSLQNYLETLPSAAIGAARRAAA